MRPLIAVLVALLLNPGARAQERTNQELWLYYPTNLLVAENVDKLEQIWGRAAKAGYTHVLIADSKFSRLSEMDKRYFDNVERTKQIAKANNLTLVPALFSVGYSNDFLSMDPNLAEGLPVNDSLFVVGEDGTAAIQADPPVKLEKIAFKDDPITLDGKNAVFAPSKDNTRLCYTVPVKPFRCYHISVKVKTEGYTARPEVKVLAGDHSLQWQYLPVKPTQDWNEHHVVFNSLDHDNVNVYFGIWGGALGKLELSDWNIEEVGLLNVLRRPGAPLVVKDENSGKALTEGTDFEPVADPKMGNQPYAGEYEVWHESPTIKTKLPAGTRLRVSWYHPAIIHEGQGGCCPADPKTTQLLADQAKRMKATWGTDAYMMSHDEIRTLGWDASCQSTGKTPGEILADNVKQCVELLKPHRTYVWNDMFDPHHNAVKGPYYLVNGDLTGSWVGLSKDTVIMNWNEGGRDKSLQFFADRGHRQVIATYYDDPSLESTKRWLATAKDHPSVDGFMYTTWQNNYEHIEAFASACKARPR
ncbi:MAG: hypothetical protein M3Q75_10265 [Gemmatimonadota bacterium]|nr:hypothetical protein [Gemmatimonadota bacterium]